MDWNNWNVPYQSAGGGGGDAGAGAGRGGSGRGRGEGGGGRGGEGRRQRGAPNPSRSNWRERTAVSEDRNAYAGPFQHQRGGNRPQNNSQQNSPRRNDGGRFRPPRFGFKKLEQIIAKEPEEAMLEIINLKDDVLKFISEDITNDCLVLLVNLFATVSKSSFRNNVASVLSIYTNATFFDKLEIFIARLHLHGLRERNGSRYFWNDVNGFFKNLATFCDALLDVIPKRSTQILPSLIKAVIYTIPNVEQEHRLEINEDVKVLFENLQVKLVDIKEKETQVNKTKSLKGGDYEVEEVEPLDNFREISIYPISEELFSESSYSIRKNKIEGGYTNVEQYLDIQFRLLREDFVAPLRQGIAEHLHNRGNKKRVSNIKIYENVQVLYKKLVNSEMGSVIQVLAKDRLKNVERSKRLMFGSLVAFTEDDFKNTKFGKVIDRDLSYLRKGQVVVGFFDNTELEFNKIYKMLECLVYFEPYYQVLNALQHMRADRFPMREYLVDVDNILELPGYLNNRDMLLYNKEISIPIEDAEDLFSDEEEYEEILSRANRVTTIESYSLPISNTAVWQNGTDLGLNAAQCRAFKAALTNKFCIIQGPPGTGKTYIGLKIAKVLLDNNEIWSDMGPMLVICYTNHALDQFLEGLTAATSKLVRVGGQSRNENLQQYNLKNHRYRYSKNTPALLRKRDILHYQKDKLNRLNNEHHHIVEADGIMDLFTLDGFGTIDPYFYNSWFYKSTDKDILFWLLEEALTWNVNIEQAHKPEEEETFEMEEYEVTNQKSKHNLDLEEEIEANRETTQLVSIANINERIFDLTKKIERYDQNTGVYYQAIGDLHSWMQQRELLKQKQNYLRIEFDNIRKPYNVNYEDPMQMDYAERWNLYRYWTNLYKERLSEQILAAEEDYRTLYKEYEEVRDMYDAIYMKTCDVIGMTTTGAARLQTTLMTLHCPIVIVEEAAEVLEAHIVTALTDQCKHLILIGDHKQLRPSTADYVLDKKFNLGISLFERMILNGFDSNTLNIQHRMRPEIANLVCPSVYDDLENHESVANYPPMKGVEKSMFFITHDKPEKESSDSSKENQFEATYMIMLANYLVLNGYEPKKITILSAYSGQFFQMVKVRKNFIRLADVKITILDNYQGEENDVILLSLVRNNSDNKIGFLSLENRVCVALSRAKMGLYIMGNIDLLCANSKIWPKIRMVLEEHKCLGSALPLKCQNHPNNRTLITNIEDFDQVPEGGCTQICNQLMNCGHRCLNMCHVLPHSSYKCFEPCLKILCENNHICPKLCNVECGNCMVPKIATLPCGHTHEIPCHCEPEEYRCPTQVEAKLECGHLIKKRCSDDIKNYSCSHPCEARIEPCGHSCSRSCHINQDPKHLNYTCYKPCERPNVDCSMPDEPDHKCSKYCSEPCSLCNITILKKRTVCSHAYHVKCHEDVDLLTCKKPCRRLMECGHACKQKCSDACGNCAVKVTKIIEECKHEVKIECCKIPSRVDCTQKCANTLKCGHKCAFKCKIDCYKNPCKALITLPAIGQCGHNVTVPCYLKDVYTADDTLKYCKNPCDVKLACEHICTGTCGTCYQSRLHVPCKEKCTNTLVCGHDCKVPCRGMCQPCTLPCSYRCNHSKCKKKCGDLCTPCVEKCSRRCKHGACTKLCNQKCDFRPCSEPCDKWQQCGHKCVGYCGEPCPPYCPICTANKGEHDDVKEIFFGNEEDEGARFVYLEECGHILEGSGLDTWFETATKSSEVAALSCPKCKTLISQTQRYSDYIKMSFMDLQSVKKRFCGDGKKNKIDLDGLIIKSNICQVKHVQIRPVRELISRWISDLGKQPNEQLIKDCQSKLQIIEDLCETYTSAKVTEIAPKELLDKHFNFLLEYLNTISNVSKQNILDYELELKRFTRLMQMCQIMNNARVYYENLREYTNCRDMILRSCRYSEVRHADAKQLLIAFNDKTRTGLNITDKERKEIISAMGLSKGHWFKCPQGHVYAIGECGGAMQRSKCPECGSVIGGESHSLERGNALAPEMDAARYPAYSDMANILNFNLDNLM